MMRGVRGVSAVRPTATMALGRRLVVGVVLSLALAGWGALAAPRALGAPAWQITSAALPTHFAPGDAPADEYQLTLANVGADAGSGIVTITDTLPNGMVTAGTPTAGGVPFGACTEGAGNSVVVCTFEASLPEFGAPEAFLPPFEVQRFLSNADAITVPVTLTGTPSGSNVVTVEAPGCGGTGEPACPAASNPVFPGTPPFGVLGFDTLAPGVSGAADTQAGDHPVSLTANLGIPNVLYDLRDLGITELKYIPGEELKDAVVDLPLGLVGNPQAALRCPLAAFSASRPTGDTECPVGSQVGVFTLVGITGVDAGAGPRGQGPYERNPIFNLVPERGHPAEFGMYLQTLDKYVVMYPSTVPTPAGYVLRVAVPDVPRVAAATSAQVTFFGNPTVEDKLTPPGAQFLTNPSSCSGEPLMTTVHVDSWEHPAAVPLDANGSLDFSQADFGEPQWKSASSSAPAVSGCGALHFNASIDAQFETARADEPSGLVFDLRVPQAPAGGLGTPPLRTARVVLPAGVGVDAGVADGLEGCSDAQIALASSAPGSCPEASQIGTVEIHTPLLDHPVPGRVFLGSPECGPCSAGDAASGRMVRLFIQADDPLSGVVLKLPGRVLVDPVSGQLTAVFADNPQLPFDELVMRLKGGPRAPLATPQSCGVFTTMSDLTPWSAPATPDANPSSSMSITGGCGGGFAPSFTGGTVTPLAGAFSPFTVSLSRHGGEQDLLGLSVSPPPGLLGVLAGVQRCPEPQASQGSCGEGSLIGHVQAAVGSGSHPFWAPGRVYLTGPYKGGPLGLSVVVPAVAGPFNLGTVVVRAAVNIDPHTAQVTVTSDPLPQIVAGIQERIQTLNVSIDRPGFIFNPTSCNSQQVTGSVTSTQGTTVGVSAPFAVGGCRTLPFHPAFTVSTQAKTSKHNGAGLVVKVGYPAGAQANIRSVAVSLPKQLPSRLTTIQQACPEATFNTNPASCPAGSDIGTATASTPVLSNPVVGPAYLVSHGGAAFPNLVVILQGEGITIDLVGSIDIKKGVTSSTFASVPDAPVSSFTLTLPQGPHSALATNLPAKAKGSLCGQTLTMPTTITGQNGAVVKQSTKIAVTGCAKPKRKGKARHGQRTRRAHGKKAKK
jgi:hypothetical protein